MEDIGEVIWYVAAYAQCFGVIGLLGGLVLACLYACFQDRMLDRRVANQTPVEESM